MLEVLVDARNQLGELDHNSQLWFSFRDIIIAKMQLKLEPCTRDRY